MTAGIANVNRIIRIANTRIPLTDNERTVVATLRHDGNPDPELYQGQVIAKSYDRLGVKIPQSLVAKTFHPLQSLIREIFVPALSEKLDALCGLSAKDLILRIHVNDFDGDEAELPQTNFELLKVATGLITKSMVEITQAVKAAIMADDAEPIESRKRACAAVHEIERNAANFDTVALTQIITKWPTTGTNPLSSSVARAAFAAARDNFFSYQGGTHFKCPAHTSMIAGMFGNDFSALLRLMERIRDVAKSASETGIVPESSTGSGNKRQAGVCPYHAKSTLAL